MARSSIEHEYKMQTMNLANIPNGAQYITDDDLLKIISDRIKTWNPKKEMWPFTYGGIILGATAGFGGIFFNHIYRKQLHLRNFARVSTYLSSFILPSLVAPILHSSFISTNILLGKFWCPLCVEMQSLALQVTVGSIYPLILTALSSFHFANRYYTYPVPPFHSGVRELFSLWRKMTLPYSSHIGFIVILQALTAVIITREEREKILIIHKYLKSSLYK